MEKRFKWPLKPLLEVGTQHGARRWIKNQKRHGFAVLGLVFALCLTLISPVHAEDHKTRVINFLSSGIKTASTSQSSAFDVSAYAEGLIYVGVTVIDGSSTLKITVQTSPDNVTWYTYIDYITMSQITTTGQYRQAITKFGNYLRISYTVNGTAVTFSVTGVFKN